MRWVLVPQFSGRFIWRWRTGAGSGRFVVQRVDSDSGFTDGAEGTDMLLIRGLAGGTGLTGTLYEPGETPPSYRGAPDVGAPYVWVCDEFYAVETGRQTLELDDGPVQVAFEQPAPRGYDNRERAVAAAKAHIREQFARIGVTDQVTFETEDVAPEAAEP